jgi:hypothetical protein
MKRQNSGKNLRKIHLKYYGQDWNPGLIEEPLARSIKLYQSSTVNGLLSDHRETPCVAFDDWDHIQRLLLDAPLA